MKYFADSNHNKDNLIYLKFILAIIILENSFT